MRITLGSYEIRVHHYYRVGGPPRIHVIQVLWVFVTFVSPRRMGKSIKQGVRVRSQRSSVVIRVDGSDLPIQEPGIRAWDS